MKTSTDSTLILTETERQLVIAALREYRDERVGTDGAMAPDLLMWAITDATTIEVKA